jgi:putative spermidine/putrescine transport system permease protein
MGASRWQTFWHVTLPLIRPGLLAAGTFSLIISFDEFSVSMFLVGGQVITLPLEIYYYIEYIIDPTVAAISTILVGLTVAAVLAIEKSVGFERFFRL